MTRHAGTDKETVKYKTTGNLILEGNLETSVVFNQLFDDSFVYRQPGLWSGYMNLVPAFRFLIKMKKNFEGTNLLPLLGDQTCLMNNYDVDEKLSYITYSKSKSLNAELYSNFDVFLIRPFKKAFSLKMN